MTMWTIRGAALSALATALLTGCPDTGDDPTVPLSTATVPPVVTPTAAATPTATAGPTPTPTPAPTPTPTPTPTVEAPTATPTPAATPTASPQPTPTAAPTPTSTPAPPDGDGVGAPDDLDNCPAEANPSQANSDGDALGDACDDCPLDAEDDLDNDGACADQDVCPDVADPQQLDQDQDGAGDACDPCPADADDDADNDGFCADVDLCPLDADPAQIDTDADQLGDACDPCPADASNDADQDSQCADTDNCPATANPDQNDVDGDTVGDACDTEDCDDRDNNGDGTIDEGFVDADGIGGADCHDRDQDTFTEAEGDCDDEQGATHPGAVDAWYDGIDSDCDGDVDPSACDVLPPPQASAPTAGCAFDLEATIVGLCEQGCDTSVTVTVVVTNHGEQDLAAGAPLTLFGITSQGFYSVLLQGTLPALAAGASSGGLVFDLGPFEGLYPYPTLVFSADDDGGGGGAVAECDERNNRDSITLDGLACPLPDPCEIEAPAYPVSRDDGCLYVPPVSDFEVTLEWQRSDFSLGSAYPHIMMTPVVGNLTDDNGDGRVDGGDVPEIVFNTFSGSSYGSPGYLRALSGDDGREQWAVYGPCASAGVALGDTNNDGDPEVYTLDCSGNLQAYDAQGVYQWTCPSGSSVTYGAYGNPAIADVDQDGQAEILANGTLCNNQGTRLVTAAGDVHNVSFLADIDLDGRHEIVSGTGVYSTVDGSRKWAGAGAYAAVANFDDDLEAEVVAIWPNGTVYLYDTDGRQMWSATLPGGGGGPPTVADYDGDGEPEIGTAGAYYYAVFETDGKLKWLNAVQDHSSQITGSSVYDFDGDGRAEVVYADELTLWVYDGVTGRVLIQETGHASGTLWEYPVVADVDKDGHAEIVVGSNNYYFSGWRGLTVLGSISNSWVTARPVWNQHAYHINNVNDDLSIPRVEPPTWVVGNNTFRQGGFGEGGALSAPQLKPGDLHLCTAGCPLTPRLTFHIENHGSNTVGAGLMWTVYGVTPGGEEVALTTGTVEDAIPAGWASAAQEIQLTPEGTAGYPRLVLSIDDDGAGQGQQNECVEADNRVELPALCPGG